MMAILHFKTAYIHSVKRDSVIRLILSIVIAFAFLTICSKSSSLYPMNDWVDVNCFFTVGRSLLDGKVMYLDICEQKGIIVYAVYAVAALISRTGFIGVFLIELLCFSAYLYYGCECVLLYCNRLSVWASTIIMSVLAFSVTTSIAFAHGGSVEECSLFMITMSLLFVLRAVRTSTYIKSRHAFMIGMFAGIALWSKFTILGFYIGLSIGVAIYYIRHRNRKYLMKNMIWFLTGMAFVTAPIILYFVHNGALAAMFKFYFYNNIFLYPGKMNNNLFTRMVSPIFNILIGIGLSIPFNGLSSVFLTVWGFSLYKHREANHDAFIIMCIGFSFLAVGTFIGGILYATYYALILSSFAPFGVAAAINVWSKHGDRFLKCSPGRCIATVVLMLILAFAFSSNTYLMQYQKMDMPQYKFAAIIREKENASLLNYGFLDGGFYTAADITPNCKYFCRLNVKLDAMDIEQRRMIEEQQVDFVVTRTLRLEDYDLDCTGYQLTDTAIFPFEGKERTYYLYALSPPQRDCDKLESFCLR